MKNLSEKGSYLLGESWRPFDGCHGSSLSPEKGYEKFRFPENFETVVSIVDISS